MDKKESDIFSSEKFSFAINVFLYLNFVKGIFQVFQA